MPQCLTPAVLNLITEFYDEDIIHISESMHQYARITTAQCPLPDSESGEIQLRKILTEIKNSIDNFVKNKAKKIPLLILLKDR